MSRAETRVFVLWMDKQLAKEEGVGGEKKFFPLNTIKSSAVKLFSVPKAIYILDRWRNFSNFMPVTSFPKHLSKNIPCHIINYSLTDYLYYLMSALLPTHTQTHSHTNQQQRLPQSKLGSSVRSISHMKRPI